MFGWNLGSRHCNSHLASQPDLDDSAVDANNLSIHPRFLFSSRLSESITVVAFVSDECFCVRRPVIALTIRRSSAREAPRDRGK